MKNKTLLTILSCLLVLCCLLTACDTSNLSSNGSKTTTTPTPTTTTSTEKTTKPTPSLSVTTTRNEPKPEDMPHDEQLLLGGINVTSFRIVYGTSPLLKEISNTNKTIAEDIGDMMQGENSACQFDYESALRLQALIKELFGYDIEIVDSASTARDISQYEIVLGEADNRLSHIRTTEGLRDEQYICKFNTAVTNMPYHYIIAGGSYGATWHAIDAIEQYLRATLAENPDAVINIEKEYSLSGTYEFKSIACIGDSITRGSQAFPSGPYAISNGMADKFGEAASSVYLEQYLSYPATLQREMWKDYLVYNYGRGASTMMDIGSSDNPYYATTTQFNSCLARSNEANFDFDLVLIMLGTNDAASCSLSDTYKNQFTAEAESLITQIKAGSPNAKFVLMNAPHRCDGDKTNSADANMRAIQKETAIALKAKGYDVYHYDMEAYTIENLSTTGGCSTNDKEELNVHEYYYNIRFEQIGPGVYSVIDKTHPNCRGYGKIAEGMKALALHLLENGQAPKYMINIG